MQVFEFCLDMMWSSQTYFCCVSWSDRCLTQALRCHYTTVLPQRHFSITLTHILQIPFASSDQHYLRNSAHLYNYLKIFNDMIQSPADKEGTPAVNLFHDRREVFMWLIAFLSWMCGTREFPGLNLPSDLHFQQSSSQALVRHWCQFVPLVGLSILRSHFLFCLKTVTVIAYRFPMTHCSHQRGLLRLQTDRARIQCSDRVAYLEVHWQGVLIKVTKESTRTAGQVCLSCTVFVPSLVHSDRQKKAQTFPKTILILCLL